MNDILRLLEEIRPEGNYLESEDFVEDGLLDSFDVIMLVSAIEEMYDIRVSGKDVLPEYFVSLEKIAELVKKNGGVVKDN